MTITQSNKGRSLTIRLLRWLLGLLLLVMLLITLLPVLVSTFAGSWLDSWALRNGLDGAEIADIRLALWDGSLDVEGLVVHKGDKPLISIPHGHLRIRPMALLEQQLLIEDLRLSGVRIRASGDKDGHLRVGDFSIAVPADWELGADGVATKLKSDWQVLLTRMTLDDLGISYADPDFRAEATVDQVQLLDNGQRLHIGRIDVEEGEAVLVLPVSQRLQSRGLLQWAVFGKLYAPPSADAASPDTDQSGGFQFQLDQLRLHRGSRLRFIDERLNTHFDTTLAIDSAVWSGLDSSHPQQPSKLQASAVAEDGGTVQLDGSLHLFSKPVAVDFALTLQKLTLAGLAAYTEAIQGEVAQGGLLSATLELHLEHGNHRIRVREAEVDGLHLSLSADAAGELSLAKLALGRPLDGVAGEAFTGRTSGPAVAFKVDELRLTDAQIGYREPGFQVRIAADRLQLIPGKRLVIDTLGLLDLKLAATLDRKSRWRADGIVRRLLFSPETNTVPTPVAKSAARLMPNTGQGTVAASDGQTSAADPFDLRLRLLEVAGDSGIDFNDNSVQPPFAIRLGSIRFATLAGKDDTSINSPAKTSLDLKLGRHGKIRLRGTTSRRIPHLNMDLAGTMESLELPQFSNYSVHHWGFAMLSGQIDGQLQLRTHDSQVKGSLGLTIHGLAVETRDAQRLAKLEQALPVSLETAIGLITEKDGSIPLTLNFSGDIDQPELGIDFDLGAAIGRALGDITQTAIVVINPLTLVLFELVSDPGEDPIDPVLFDPGQNTLNQRATAWLDQVGGAMKGNPKIRIRACGRGVAADLIGNLPGNLAGGAKRRSNRAASEQTRLAELARRRGAVVKDYLVDKVGVSASQVIACSGKVKQQQIDSGYSDDDDAGEFPGQGVSRDTSVDVDAGQPRTDLLL